MARNVIAARAVCRSIHLYNEVQNNELQDMPGVRSSAVCVRAARGGARRVRMQRNVARVQR